MEKIDIMPSPKPKKEPKNKTVKEKKERKAREPKKPREPKNKTKKMSSSSPSTKQNIPALTLEFQQKGITVLENITEKDIEAILLYCNDAYYNSNKTDKTAPLTDNEYDIIKEYMEKKCPRNAVLAQIGADPHQNERNKVALPYEMWSMDKIKPDTEALQNWMTKYRGPYVVSCKLDGVSGLLTFSTNNPTKLYTRGNGTIGQDISHLLPHIPLPLSRLKTRIENIAVRGEFILPKALFQQKYGATFANPRNLVSGIINSKTLDINKINDLHFVVYEVIQPVMPPREQMALLQECGFEVVQHETREHISNVILSNDLVEKRAEYTYEIDGIIVANNAVYPRKSGGNPEHAFAFKMVLSEQVAEAKVVDVVWSVSKDGYLKPRVRIEPIQLGGVKIEYATGFNGNFIQSNSIGIGALIKVIRSGDVIPYIQSVVVPAQTAKMPDVPYHWGDSHIDIIVDALDDNEGVKEKNNAFFMTTLEVDGLSIGNIKRIMKTGNDTIPKILHMTKLDFERVEGFKTKMADKIYTGLQAKIKEASLTDLMVASNKMGRGLGKKKIAVIMETFTVADIFQRSPPLTVRELRAVPGIGEENATAFLENIGGFKAFLQECGLEYKYATNSNNIKNTNDIRSPDRTKTMPLWLDTKEREKEKEREPSPDHPLRGKKIVMTKIRDATIIAKMKEVGGIVEDNIGKTTYALIVKTKADVSNKTKYAVEHNIPIYEPKEFIEAFF